MSGLTSNATPPRCVIGKKAGSNTSKSPSDKDAGSRPLDPSAAINSVFNLGSAVYVRYKDHVLFKNISQPIAEAIERETIGWLTKQNDDIMLIEHDRTIPNIQLPTGQGSGVIILKSCIIEIHVLPLQKSSEWHLNSQKPSSKGEYALAQNKRKTHSFNQGAKTHCKQ